MYRLTAIIAIVLSALVASGQVVFKTIVPQQPVAVGESFPVQYVLEDIDKNDGFTAPSFPGFRLVSGPYFYDGKVYSLDGLKPLKNILFTLVAIKPGKFTIPGATARVNGRIIKSDDVQIEVVSRTEAFEKMQKTDNGSEYFLRPEEDPYVKMRENLFMKVLVNKRSCYVGEPVVATFKLYSRLQSKSDIVKNPGFYGFSVQDIISLADRVAGTETMNGKLFDVHTVRTVQLYPLQAGTFVIDPMELENRVEFSRSVVNKRPEQEIKEGVRQEREPSTSENGDMVTYENTLSTEKIAINVKPHPTKNKPVDFTGATGNFLIRAALEKDDLLENEEGDLVVTLEGKGNFPQLSAPVINWPAEIEGFDAIIRDTINKAYVPLSGSRSFRFPFVANKAGSYQIRDIAFTFFDPDSNRYKTIIAPAVDIKIDPRPSGYVQEQEEEIQAKEQTAAVWWRLVAVVFFGLTILAATIVWIRRRRRRAAIPLMKAETAFPGIDELLNPAQKALAGNDRSFYSLLQKGIWDHLKNTLSLSGSKMNKVDLRLALAAKYGVGKNDDLLEVLSECESAIFTSAERTDDRQALLERGKAALGRIV
ncbi:MAG: protein BatD [Chitinophagaceae bacterium]|nr:protein BatD [Chitinophagaceae bacterium]